MAIEVDLYERIRHLHENEGKSAREIARVLGVSRNTVRKYCEGAQVPWERQGKSGRSRHVVTDEVIDFVRQCLQDDVYEGVKKQQHTAKRIYDRLVAEKGFEGGQSTIRRLTAELQPKPVKAFVPLSFEPGEAIQVDWGEAHVYMNGQKIKLQIFCMRECFSADIFCRAFYRQNEESFLEAQVAGFEYFRGTPRRVIFDNAKVAVKDGFGSHAQVCDRYRALAAHHAFQPDFCNIGQAHEKGLVEGLVGWTRRNLFVPIPRVESADELNKHLLEGCYKYRNHTISGRSKTVGEMARIAQDAMTPLPPYQFDPSKTATRTVGEFSTIQFDRNQYSVPMKYVGREVSVKGYGNHISIVYQGNQLAQYHRMYGQCEPQYRLEHYIDMIEQRPRSVYNAKPVKSNMSAQLMSVGSRLSGPKEMVRFVRICMEYGEDKVLNAVESLNKAGLTIEGIQACLEPNTGRIEIPSSVHITVPEPDFEQYNVLVKGGPVS